MVLEHPVESSNSTGSVASLHIPAEPLAQAPGEAMPSVAPGLCDAITLNTVHCTSATSRDENFYDHERVLAGGDALCALAASQVPIEGLWRGEWAHERGRPSIPAREQAIIEGRL